MNSGLYERDGASATARAGRVRELVRRSDDEGVERVARVQTRRAPVIGGRDGFGRRRSQLSGRERWPAVSGCAAFALRDERDGRTPRWPRSASASSMTAE